MTPEERYYYNAVKELEAENAALREENRRLLDLMMSGEALREKLMIKAICAGAFNPKEGEAPCQ